MTIDVSRRAGAVQPTLIRLLRDKARPSSLDLGLGQPDLPVEALVREAVAADLAAGQAPYSPNLGFGRTREAIGDHLGIGPDGVMVTCGVQEALAVAILGLAEEGDEVLVPDPGFPAYPNLVRLAGATPVAYPLDADRGFRLDPDAVAERLGERTRAIILNSPSNPTGAVHAADDLADVLKMCADRGVVWISDEIYADYLWDGARHVSPADVDAYRDGGVRLGGLSKSHHMMGWRLGWLAGPAALVEALKPLHQHLVTCAPTIAQEAAVVALAHHDALFAATRKIFAERRRVVCEALDAIDGVGFTPPEGAFYVFVDARAYTEEGLTSLGLAEELLADEDVVAIPGSGFGAAGEGFLRIAYTLEAAKLEEAMARIARFFARRS